MPKHHKKRTASEADLVEYSSDTETFERFSKLQKTQSLADEMKQANTRIGEAVNALQPRMESAKETLAHAAVMQAEMKVEIDHLCTELTQAGDTLALILALTQTLFGRKPSTEDDAVVPSINCLGAGYE